jgi:hypothetical protein
MIPARCTALGGVYQGDLSTCAASCTPLPSDRLLPPNAINAGGTWAWSPEYRQPISASGLANGVRIIASAAATAGGGYQADAQMRITAPNGTVLALGQDTPVGWSGPALISGTPPAFSENAQAIDALYAWDFGPMEGQWSVNVRASQAIAPGAINWSGIQIVPVQLPTGACCLPSGPCEGRNIVACQAAGGTYHGDGSACAATACPGFLQTALPTSQESTNQPGIFFDLSAANDVTITALEYRTTVAAGTPVGVEVWVRSGSYIGHDTSPAGWTLHDTINNAISTGPNSPVFFGLANPLSISAGQTTGIYLLTQSGGIRFWGDPSRLTFSDMNLSLYGEHVRTLPWSGTLRWPRVFAGRIYYSTAAVCYANCDNSTVPPILNVEDFTCFINEFAAGSQLPHAQQINHYANCDASTTAPVLNVEDFTCFINRFAAGCR